MAKKPARTRTAARSRARRPASPTAASKKPAGRPVVLGLLPTPPEVAELVERDLKDHPVSDAEHQRLTDGYNLQYHCGDEEVIYRHTPQGVEVLAVGLKNVGELWRKLPPEERESVVIDHPDPW
jgi:hypothetical protein